MIKNQIQDNNIVEGNIDEKKEAIGYRRKARRKSHKKACKTRKEGK